MDNLIEDLAIYSRSHTQLATRITHYIGVPLATIPIFILLNWVVFGINGWFELGVSWLVLIGLFLYYLSLDREIAIATVASLAVLNLIARWIGGGVPNWMGIKMLILTGLLAAAMQLLGHYFEGKRPALMDNFWQIIIAPVFLVAEVFFWRGEKQALAAEIKRLANQ